MKNIKKLIIASVLSMITASCYAGSIVVGSEQQSSVDIGFASPQQLSVTFAPVAGLKAGVIKSNTDIATIAVSSVAAKQFAIAADFKAKDVMNGDTAIHGLYMVKILAKESKCTSMVRQPHQRGM